MEHLVVITPKDGSFADSLRESCIFKQHALSANYAYFTYIGNQSPIDKVYRLLSAFRFKEFSLDKETNYYRLKVFAE